MKSKILHTAAAAAVVMLLANASAAAVELKVHGSTSVAAIVNKNKAAIEQETGLTLKVTANGDGNGLKDLTAGTADVAMAGAGELIQAVADSMNKLNPGAVTVAGLEIAPVGTNSLKFIVNPANPVKSLTAEQLKDILTGKITSWKDVGGADLPIMVVTLPPGLGTRAVIVMKFLGGTEITDKARVVQALSQLPQVVAQAPNAISYGNESTITDKVAVIPGSEVAHKLVMVTKGAPSADVKKLIAAVAKYGTAN